MIERIKKLCEVLNAIPSILKGDFAFLQETDLAEEDKNSLFTD